MLCSSTGSDGRTFSADEKLAFRVLPARIDARARSFNARADRTHPRKGCAMYSFARRVRGMPAIYLSFSLHHWRLTQKRPERTCFLGRGKRRGNKVSAKFQRIKGDEPRTVTRLEIAEGNSERAAAVSRRAIPLDVFFQRKRNGIDVFPEEFVQQMSTSKD